MVARFFLEMDNAVHIHGSGDHVDNVGARGLKIGLDQR